MTNNPMFSALEKEEEEDIYLCGSNSGSNNSTLEQ